MSYAQTIPSGKTFEHEGDNVTGLITQDPQFGPSSNTWSANGDMAVSPGFVVFRGLHSLTSNTTSTITYLNKNCPYKLRVVRVTVTPRTFMTAGGGTPDTKLDVQLGDGAASEAFSDIITQIDLDGDTADVGQVGTISDANELIAANKSIISKLTTSGGTGLGGTTLVDVLIECMRVKA